MKNGSDRVASGLAVLPVLAMLLLVAVIAGAFGGVESWGLPLGWCLMAVVLAATGAALSFATQDFLGRTTGKGPPFPWLVLAAFVLLLAFVAIQASSAVVDRYWHPIWQSAAEVLGRPLNGAMSVAPDLTRRGLGWMALYVALCCCAWMIGRNARLAALSLKGFLVVQAVIAAYGLLVFSTGNEVLLWLERSAYTRVVTGTFVNRNSYATFVGLGVLVAAVLLAVAIRHAHRHEDEAGSRLKTAIATVLGTQRYLLACLLLLLIALLMTGSRAGIAATGFACVLALTLMLGRNRPLGRTVLGGLAILLLSGALFTQIIPSSLADRLEDSQVQDALGTRLDFYKATIIAAREAPIYGTGFNTFEYGIQPYLPIELAMESRLRNAHNTYLEQWLELGWPMALLLLASIAWLAVLCARGAVSRRRNHEYALIGFAATFLVGLHATVDFSMEIPGVVCGYLMLLGIGVAQSYRTSGA